MSSIDDRIVRLEVQDSDFAKRLEADEKALKKLDETIGKVGSSGVADNLQKIADKFSNLGIVGVTAIQNIADKAVDAGTKIVKSLTVDNIASGWEKLASQTKAVGTLSIQGYDEQDVNDVIKQLMWYTDETSYNFEDMLTSMTKFTAQGYELKDALRTLEGIANWSAVAGQNAAAGSAAMSALSKAVGRGYVQQQDWSSLQTLMMDNKQVRQMILDTAVELGTLEKTGDKTYRSLSKAVVSSLGASEFDINQFATYLTTGKWLTSDVLVATMQKYAQAVEPVYRYVEENNVSAADAIKALNGQLSEQALDFFSAAQEARSLGDALESVRVGSASTWQKTFNIIFGDYERQKEIWTDLSGYLYDLFVESGNARNALLEDWAAKGGADDLIQGFYNIMDALIALRDTIKTAWQSVFPPATSEALLNFTEKFKNFTQNLILNEESAQKLGRTFQGVFSILKLGKDILEAILKPIASLFGSSNNLVDSILTIGQTVGDVITNFVHWIEVNGILEKSVNLIVSIVKAAIPIVKTIGKIALVAILAIAKGIITLISSIKNLGTNFSSVIQHPIQSFTDFIKKISGASKETEVLIEVQRSYASAVNETDEETKKASKSIDAIKDAFKSFGEKLKSTYTDYIKPVFDAIINFLGLKDIFEGGLIPGLMKLLSIFIAFKTVFSIGNLFTSFLDGIAGILRTIWAFGSMLSGLAMNLKATAWLKFAAAIGIVAFAIYKLASLDLNTLIAGLARFSHITNVVAQAINKVSIAGAMGIWIISKANIWPIIAAIAALAAAIWGLNVGANIISKFGGTLKEVFSPTNQDAVFDFLNKLSSTIGLFVDAIFNWKTVVPLAILTIAQAMKKLSKNAKEMFSVLSPKLTVNIFQKDTSFAAKLLKFAVSLGIIVASVYVLTNKVDPTRIKSALIALGALATGLTVMSAALAGISVLANKLGFETYGKELLNIAVSVGIFTAAVVALGYISQKNSKIIEDGFEAIWGMLLTIFVGSFLISQIESTQHTANVLKSLAGAFVGIGLGAIFLAGALSILTKYNWRQLLTGMIALALNIAVIGAVIYAISKSVGAIEKAGRRLVALGISFMEFSAGTILIASAIGMLSTIDTKQLIVATGALILSIGTIAGAMSIMNKWATSNIFKNLGFIAAIGGFFALMIELAYIAKQFEMVSDDSLKAMTGALALIVAAGAAVTAVGYLLSQLDLKSLGLGALGVGGLLLILGGLELLVAGMAKVLKMFEGIDSSALKTMASTIAIFGAAAAVITVIGGVLGVAAEAFPEFAIPIVAAIAGILAVMWAMAKIIETALPPTGEFLVSFATAIKILMEAVAEFADNLGTSAPKIANGIRELAYSIGDSIVYICESIAKGIGAVASFPVEIAKGFASGIMDVINIFKGGGEQIANATAEGLSNPKSLEQASKAALAMVSSYGGTTVEVAKSYSGKVNEEVESGNQQVMKTEQKWYEKALDWLATSATTAIGMFNPITRDVGKAVNWGIEKIGTDAKEKAGTEAEETGGFSIESLDKGLSDAIDKYAGPITDKISSLFGYDSDTMFAAYNYGSTLGALMGNAMTMSFANTAAPLMSEDLKRKTSLGSKFSMISMETAHPSPGGKASENSIDSWISSLQDSINGSIPTISPEFDTGSLDDYADKLKNSNLSVDVGADLTKAYEGIDALVRQYHDLYESESDRWQQWTYNGPLGGVIDEETEWVYEGPTGGLYNKEEDKYYATVGGQLYDLANWTQSITEKFDTSSLETLESLSNIDQNVTSSILDQTALDEKYNSSVLTQLGSLGDKIDTLDGSIGSLGDSFSNMGIYLDSGALVGGLSEDMYDQLSQMQNYIDRGVYR